MADPQRFISLEDEIIFRRAIRTAYRHEGLAGVFQCMGEMNQCLKIAAEVALELINEEEKKK